MIVLALSLLNAARWGPWLFPQEPWAPETSATGGTILRLGNGGGGVLYCTNGVALFKSLDGGRTWNSRPENFFLSPRDLYVSSPNFLFLYGDDGLLYSVNGGQSFSRVSGVPAGAKAARFAYDYRQGGNRLGLVLTVSQGGNRQHELYFNSSPADTQNWQRETVISESDSKRIVSDAFFVWPFGIITTEREDLGIVGEGKLYYTVDGSSWTEETLNGTGEIHDLAIAPMPNDDICIMLATEVGLVVFGVNFPNDYKVFQFGPLSKVVVAKISEDTVIAYLAPRSSTEFRKVRIVWRQNANAISCTTLNSVGVPEGMADAMMLSDDSLIVGTYGLGVAISDSLLNLSPSNDGLYAWTTLYPGGLWAKGPVAYSVDLMGRVMKTEDGGRTWRILNLDPIAYGVAVAACPTKPEEVYVSAVGVSGSEFKFIWRSHDGGQSWDLVGPDFSSDPFIPVAMAVSWDNPEEVWAVRWNLFEETGFPSWSNDGGQSWSQVTGINASQFNWVATAPGGTVLWATDNGVWSGRPGSWRRLPGSLTSAQCVFFNPADSSVYAVGTNALFKLENDTLRPIYSFAPSTGIVGVADGYGDIAILAYSPDNFAQVFYTQNLGQTWSVDSTFVASVSVGLVGYGKVISASIGQGIRRGPWERPAPSLRLTADPDSVQVGDTIYIVAQANVPLQTVSCTLYLPQDTLSIAMERQDQFTYKGEINTAGLYGGRGAVRAQAIALNGDTLVAEDSILITVPGASEGEVIVADSVFPWPNPAGDELNFHLFSETGAQVTVVLINVEGRPVANAKAELRPMQTTDISVDISRVSSGLYLWKVAARSGGTVKTLSGKLTIRK